MTELDDRATIGPLLSGLAVLTLVVGLVAGCADDRAGPLPPAPVDDPRAGPAMFPIGGSWDWHLTGGDAPLRGADVVDLDLFDTSAAQVAAHRSAGSLVICYFSAGTVEEWRDDAGSYPPSVVGNDWGEWPGERFVDISRIDLLEPMLVARLDQCAQRGFDGVEADNVDVYGADTGFELDPGDGIALVGWLAAGANERGMAFGLKNAPDIAEQVSHLVDFAIVEDCHADGWCDQLRALSDRGKAVYAAEYTDRLGVLDELTCEAAARNGVSVTLFDRDLDGATYERCP